MVNRHPLSDGSAGIYAHIKEQLLEGVHPPGAQIKVNETAADLGLSATPVREVLARLVGEGLLQDRRRLGFFVPRPTSYEVVDLLLLSELCLTTALRRQFQAARALPPSIHPGEAEDPTGTTDDPAAALFRAILSGSSNKELVATGERTVDRLAPVRRAEKLILGSREEEIAALQEMVRGEEAGPLRAAVRAYHRLSRAHAEDVAHLMAEPRTRRG